MRPWSDSRLSCYEDCPKQYWYRYVEHMPSFREDSPAATRGSGIHKQAELYLKGEIHMYPPELQKVSGHAMKLKALKATPEQQLAVTEQWTRCEWDAPEAYFRGIIDITYKSEPTTVHIEDWKSGQIYKSHDVQISRYVALAAPDYPEAEKFVTRLIYLDQGVVTPPKIVPVDRIKPIRLMLDGSIHNAEADEIFPVKPGSACKWCGYSRKYGGPCPYPRD